MNWSDASPLGNVTPAMRYVLHSREDISADYSWDEICIRLCSFISIHRASSCAGIFLDPSRLIPMESEHLFTYAGSLTTPPCNEDVSWYLLPQAKIDMSVPIFSYAAGVFSSAAFLRSVYDRRPRAAQIFLPRPQSSLELRLRIALHYIYSFTQRNVSKEDL